MLALDGLSLLPEAILLVGFGWVAVTLLAGRGVREFPDTNDSHSRTPRRGGFPIGPAGAEPPPSIHG
jgi:hypothetical protein